MIQRIYSHFDQFLIHLDRSLRILTGRVMAIRPYPAQHQTNTNLSEQERNKSISYMRVNHVGEICAQALYQSQALTARNILIRKTMEIAAIEELDHLSWCEQRIEELGGKKSILNVFWYASSFLIGFMVGIAGDNLNLRFLVETEKQVVEHLDEHLKKLPKKDYRSRVVLHQMKIDEAAHAQAAALLSGSEKELPRSVKTLMRIASQTLMTKVAYWI